MSSTDRGGQTVVFDFKNPLQGGEFNKLLRGILKHGIYQGGGVAISTVNVANDSITIQPFQVAINAGTDKLVNITTSSAFTLTANETDGPQSASDTMLIMRYGWDDVIQNYIDFAYEDAGTYTPLDTDVVVCTITYSAYPAISALSTTTRTNGIFDDDYNLIVENTLETDLITERTLNTGINLGASSLIIDQANTRVRFPLGAAATPSLTPNGDPNSGIWSPGGDIIAISCGGVESLRIQSNAITATGTAPYIYLTDTSDSTTQSISYDSTIFYVGGSGTACTLVIRNQTSFGSSMSIGTTGLISITSLGTAGAPSLYFGTDSDTGIWSPGADEFAISTNGVERIRVLANVVSIENSSPQTWQTTFSSLQIGGLGACMSTTAGSASEQMAIMHNAYRNTSSAWTYIINDEATLYQQTSGTHVFYTAAASTGTISWTSQLTLNANGTVAITSLGTAGAPSLYFGTDSDTGIWTPSGGIISISSNSGEKFRVDNGGILAYGTIDATGVISTTGAQISCTGGIVGFSGIFNNSNNNVNGKGLQITCGQSTEAGTNVYIDAYRTAAAGQTGWIGTSTGTFALTDVSDKRLKQDIKDYTKSGLDIINNLKVRTFKYKNNLKNNKIGFIAQEVQETFPLAVCSGGTKENYLGVARDTLVIPLVKAVQELSDKVKTLENQLAQSKKTKNKTNTNK